ncbi:hypothetical protein PanWU01x14_368640 [Parasponia andersonii]|uniref:Uncharacterized protein n=1 Tax=Parasponia andersonii TaxID=3476 RepID=A0A2P5A4Y6_PARAD|nr:hypothetical protein PanWU01x14_368640 [Parasponia andersonii]
MTSNGTIKNDNKKHTSRRQRKLLGSVTQSGTKAGPNACRLGRSKQEGRDGPRGRLRLKDEVAEVHRDNARLERLLASEAKSGRREDFDNEVQQEYRGQLPREVPAPSRLQMQRE